MPQRVTVAKVADIPDGGAIVVSVRQKDVAVFNVGGTLRAIDDMCPHMGASLAGGHVENKVVTCPWHAWRFCVTDGTWMDNKRLKIGNYAVKVEGDDVLVDAQPRPK